MTFSYNGKKNKIDVGQIWKEKEEPFYEEEYVHSYVRQL